MKVEHVVAFVLTVMAATWAIAFLISACDDEKPVVINTVEPTATATATVTATPTPLPTPQLSHGPGTLVGKTPTIGYVLICSDGVQTWQQLSLVVHPNWPPSEVCE